MAEDTTDQDLANQDYQDQMDKIQWNQQEAMQDAYAAQGQANSIAQQQLGIAERQADIADERYDYWKTYFEPVEQDLIATANAGINPTQAANIAGGEMQRSFGAAGGTVDRFLSRLGLDQADPRYATIRDDLQFAEQAAVAGAKNNARDRADLASSEMKLAVAGLGRGVSAQSLSNLGQTARTIGQAGNTQMQGASGVLQGQAYGLNLGAQNVMSTANNNAANLQFAAQRNYQQEQNQAAGRYGLFNMVGTGMGQGAGMAMSMAGGQGGGQSGGMQQPQGPQVMGTGSTSRVTRFV